MRQLINTLREDNPEAQEDDGFTLIELVIVIAVIAILAAVAIPTFLSVKGNAHTSAAQQLLANAQVDEASYYNSGNNPSNPSYATTPQTLQQQDPSLAVAQGTANVSGQVTVAAGPTPNTVLLSTVDTHGNVYTIEMDEGVSFYYANAAGGTAPSPLPAGAAGSTAAAPGTPGQWWTAWGAVVAAS